MSIKTIEIICIPCPKCETAKRLIGDAIRQIELKNKIKIPYEFKHTPNLLQVSQYSVNVSQTPIIIINGNLEFAGVATQDIIYKRLEAIQKY